MNKTEKINESIEVTFPGKTIQSQIIEKLNKILCISNEIAELLIFQSITHQEFRSVLICPQLILETGMITTSHSIRHLHFLMQTGLTQTDFQKVDNYNMINITLYMYLL